MSVNYVEYLYGDNNSYIDTGIVVQSGYQIEVTFMSTEKKLSMQKNDWSGIFGVGNAIGYSYDTAPYGISAGLYSSRVAVKNNNVTNLEYLNIDKTCYNQKYTLSLTAGENVTNPANLFLFAVNFTRDAGESNPYSWGYSCLRIYDFKIYNAQGTLIQHLRPCLDEEGIPCMYDEVSGEYFKNLGTGTFGYEGYHLYLFADNNENTAENLGSYRLYNMKIEGDSKGVESGVDYVDYLEGDGASWIDTAIVPRTGYQIDVTFMINKVATTKAIYGNTVPIEWTYDNSNGTSVAYNLSNYIFIRDNGSGCSGVTTSYDYFQISNTCLNKYYTLSRKLVNVSNSHTLYLFANNNSSAINIADNNLRISDFKIYNAQGTLIQHLRPCLDTEGVPCMYDEVSGEYFHNQGTGTFGYKKKLRDFQPVLDSNGIPTLMDKVNKKYYYDKNGKGFRYEESYKPVSYLRSDGYSWINTGIIPTTNTKVVVDTYMLLSDLNNGPALFGSTQTFLSFTFQTTVSWLYVGKINGKHSVGLAGHDFTGRHTITIDLSDMTNIVNIDGTNYGTFTGTQATDSKSIYLWNMFDSWGALGNSGGTAKIYSFKIYENNVLTMDLIPVLDNDGTPCMYDLVTETFFYNQGTGEVSYGIEEDECPKANYVEYIRGSKNAYINTLDISGMINSEVEVEWKFKLEAINKATGWFGTVANYNTTPLYARNGYDNALGSAINVVFLEPSNNVTIKTEDRHLGVHVMKINKTGLYMDGNLEAELPGTTYYDSYGFVQPFALLGYNYWNGIQSRFPENVLYYVTVKQAGELILDFRPCLDDNGVLCVYEAVNGVYYYNSDTGEFGGHGKSIGYTPIKYIETNGTQYIDTGVVPTDNTDIDMVASAVSETPLYLMNELIIDTTYKYKEIDTTVEPNLTASAGATLTLGSTYSAFLTETEIEQAINNGWTIE